MQSHTLGETKVLVVLFRENTESKQVRERGEEKKIIDEKAEEREIGNDKEEKLGEKGERRREG